MFNPLRPTWRFLRNKTNVAVWIIVFSILGVFSGLWLPKEFNEQLDHLSHAFLVLVKLVVTPIMFSTLTVGIAGHGDDLKRVGRIALKSLFYFEVATTLALVIGLGMVNALQPGGGLHFALEAGPAMDLRWEKIMNHIITPSFTQSAADNNVLQVVFCAMMFGVAMILTPSKHRKPMLTFLESLSQIMFKVTDLVMNFAPIGVGAALAHAVSALGPEILLSLGKLVGTLYLSLIVYVIVVFVPVLWFCRIPLKAAFNALARPAFIAFTTTSSEAALPLAMENMVRFGVPRSVVGFVLPTGYSFNLDGTTLHLAVASLFAAQATGVSLSFGDQLVMMLIFMIESKGIAAVPRASFLILVSVATEFGISLLACQVILGVDSFMDMARTAVNLTGNCIASIVVSVWEGNFDYELANGTKEFDPDAEAVMEANEAEKAKIREDLTHV